MKTLLAAAALCALGFVPAYGAQGGEDISAMGRNPIIYNSVDNEVGVIQHMIRRGGQEMAVVLPTQQYLDLGYYEVAIPLSALRPRPAGGWTTTLSNDAFPNLPPYSASGKPRFFMASGI